MKALALALAIAVALGLAAAAPATAADPVPLYAHYYIWFTPSSWNRAKIDYPLIGRYSSDETSVMRRHVMMARDAGIDGFLVSWKSTPVLDDRLEKLVGVAERAHFRLGIVYQGLDFERRPLPVEKVLSDLELLADRYAGSPAFAGFGRPVVAWTGTWRFSAADIERVRDAVDGRILLLGTERNPDDYRAKAAVLDGDAYYWSSVNPRTYPGYEDKLVKMAAAVHESGGIWIAPAAPGFDARLVGGSSVVPREHGETLRRQYAAAQAADPDAIGLISWNEFSENTQVEPSRKHGTEALETLADIRGTHLDVVGDLDSSELAGARAGSGPGAITAIVGFLVLLALFTALRRRPRLGAPE